MSSPGAFSTGAFSDLGRLGAARPQTAASAPYYRAGHTANPAALFTPPIISNYINDLDCVGVPFLVTGHGGCDPVYVNTSSAIRCTTAQQIEICTWTDSNECSVNGTVKCEPTADKSDACTEIHNNVFSGMHTVTCFK